MQSELAFAFVGAVKAGRLRESPAGGCGEGLPGQQAGLRGRRYHSRAKDRSLKTVYRRMSPYRARL